MTKIPIRHICSAFAAPGFSGAFNIRDVSTLLSGNDMSQELHRHSFFYILALKNGQGEHTIDFIHHPIKDQTVFLMRPGQVHQLLLKSGSEGYLIEFTRDFYTPLETTAIEVMRKATGRNFYPLHAPSSGKLFRVLADMLDEYTSKQERYIDVIRSGLDIFFIELLRQSNHSTIPERENNEHQHDLLAQFQELIEQHVSEYKQVAYYTDRLHLTPYQLNAITKTLLDKTSSAVINDHIILEAKRQLLATSAQVNQIAWQLGYEDTAYFIRFFKKHTGYSPEAFRQKFK